MNSIGRIHRITVAEEIISWEFQATLYTQDACETLDTTEVFLDTQLLQIVMEELNSGLRRQDCRGMLYVASTAEGRT
jgi:hypothetical protein